MQLVKSSQKSRNWLKDMLFIAFGIFIIALVVIFIQNFEKTPQQTEVRKEIKLN